MAKRACERVVYRQSARAFLRLVVSIAWHSLTDPFHTHLYDWTTGEVIGRY